MSIPNAHAAFATELSKVRRRCRSLVTRRAAISGTLVVLPVPGIDVAIDVYLLVEVLKRINKEFHLAPEDIALLEENHRIVVYEGVKGMGQTLIGKMITADLVTKIAGKMLSQQAGIKFLKYLPLVGQAAAGTISFVIFKWICEQHIRQCYQLAHNTRLITDMNALCELS